MHLLVYVGGKILKINFYMPGLHPYIIMASRDRYKIFKREAFTYTWL